MKKTNYLLLLLFCVSLFSCNFNNTKQWKEVNDIGGIKQGNLFKLEPLKDTVLILSGANISFTDFNFNCILLQSLEEVKYTSAVYIAISSSQGLWTEGTTKNAKFETWPKALKEQSIKLTLVYVPPPVYKGEEQVYFYLVDSAENCISNIIAWNVMFK